MSTDTSSAQFRLAVSGLPQEHLAALGAALSALQLARASSGAESAAAYSQALGKLDMAWQECASLLLGLNGTAMSLQQLCFVSCGVLAPSLRLKSPEGQAQELDLLPEDLCEALLSDLQEGPKLACVMPMRQRLEAIMKGELEPLDLDSGAKARARNHEKLLTQASTLRPASQAGSSQRHLEQLLSQVRSARTALERSSMEYQQSVKDFAASVRAEHLALMLSEAGALFKLCEEAISAEPGALKYSTSPVGRREEKSGGSVEQTGMALARMAESRRSCLQELQTLHELHSDFNRYQRLDAADEIMLETESPETGLPLAQKAPAALPAGQIPKHLIAALQKDFKATSEVLAQGVQSHRRTGLRAGLVLLQDYFSAKGAAPLTGCFATAPAVEAALAKLISLHSNSFVRDASGAAIIPPIVIGPGVGTAIWLDDRFVLAFAHTQSAMVGPKLTLSPVEQSVALLIGCYLSRGEIFNYRNERVRDSFIGEYAGEVEQKAVVKYVGAEKKITYGTSTTEKDSASREDAAKDYVDFLFHVYNGLPLPKRISTRRAGVLLKYVLLDTPARNVRLALRWLTREEPELCKEVLLRACGHQPVDLIRITEEAIASDGQLKAKYRGGAEQALREVLGRGFIEDAQAKGLLQVDADVKRPSAVGKSDDGAESRMQGHDYFDL